MKKLIMIALALTLALGIVWLPSVAAEDPVQVKVTIHKTIAEGCPEETFHFEVYRDMNLSGDLDFDDPVWGPDILTGECDIDIAVEDFCVIYPSLVGQSIIHEVLSPGSVYEQPPDQVIQVYCDVEVYFVNNCTCSGKIKILKLDEDDNIITVDSPLMEFDITPNPYAATPDPLRLVDNDSNDADASNGTILLENVPLGDYMITEMVAPDDYELDSTPQWAHVDECGQTVTLEFVNSEIPEVGQIEILKKDPAGELITMEPGACFELTPDPRTCEGSLELCDNDANDKDPAWGILLLYDCLVCCECNITETVAPPGYERDPNSQTAHVKVPGETVTVNFTNTIIPPSCGTVCAAQTAPGEFLFSDAQKNWFTWIYYDKGWGTEDAPHEYPIYTGQTTECGTLLVYDDGTHIFVNYVLKDTATCTLGGLSEYHLQVDNTFEELYGAVVKKKNPVPGKCEYSGSFDPMVPQTGWIAANDATSDWTTKYIFAHGVGCYYCP